MTGPRGWSTQTRWQVIGLTLMSLIFVGTTAAAYVHDNRPSPRWTAPATASTEPPAPATSPAITLPPEPQILVLGDSYTDGVGAEPRTQGWAYLAAEQLGAEDPAIEGFGGSGFVNPGSPTEDNTYATRLREIIADGEVQPDLIVLQGGQNDYESPTADVVAAVTAVVQQARGAWPEAQIVVLGPSAPLPFARGLTTVSGAVQQGAVDAGVAWVNPVAEGWITNENSRGYAAPDGYHLNNEGHAYVAQRFVEAVRALAA